MGTTPSDYALDAIAATPGGESGLRLSGLGPTDAAALMQALNLDRQELPGGKVRLIVVEAKGGSSTGAPSSSATEWWSRERRRT